MEARIQKSEKIKVKLKNKNPNKNMLKNKKLFITLFFVILVILIGLGIWIGITMVGSHATDPAAPSGYTAVYMTSGDIYFGKLHSFPKPYLTDALYVTRNTGQNGQTQLGLATFKSAFWSPVGEIYFNPSQVLFTAPLRNDSQIITAIQNPTSLSGGAQSGNTQSGAANSTASSTTK